MVDAIRQAVDLDPLPVQVVAVLVSPADADPGGQTEGALAAVAPPHRALRRPRQVQVVFGVVVETEPDLRPGGSSRCPAGRRYRCRCETVAACRRASGCGRRRPRSRGCRRCRRAGSRLRCCRCWPTVMFAVDVFGRCRCVTNGPGRPAGSGSGGRGDGVAADADLGPGGVVDSGGFVEPVIRIGDTAHGRRHQAGR